MTRPHKTLISEISEKAAATFGEDKTYDDWQRHWLATAVAWEQCLRAEGLNETADAVLNYIAFAKTCMGR